MRGSGPLRTCSGECQRVLPRNAIYFPRHRTKYHGLRNRCRDCDRKARRERQHERYQIDPAFRERCNSAARDARRRHPERAKGYCQRPKYKEENKQRCRKDHERKKMLWLDDAYYLKTIDQSYRIGCAHPEWLIECYYDRGGKRWLNRIDIRAAGSPNNGLPWSHVVWAHTHRRRVLPRWLIHHWDGNPRNNTPGNLLHIRESDHASVHCGASKKPSDGLLRVVGISEDGDALLERTPRFKERYDVVSRQFAHLRDAQRRCPIAIERK